MVSTCLFLTPPSSREKLTKQWRLAPVAVPDLQVAVLALQVHVQVGQLEGDPLPLGRRDPPLAVLPARSPRLESRGLDVGGRGLVRAATL